MTSQFQTNEKRAYHYTLHFKLCVQGQLGMNHSHQEGGIRYKDLSSHPNPIHKTMETIFPWRPVYYFYVFALTVFPVFIQEVCFTYTIVCFKKKKKLDSLFWQNEELDYRKPFPIKVWREACLQRATQITATKMLLLPS